MKKRNFNAKQQAPEKPAKKDRDETIYNEERSPHKYGRKMTHPLEITRGRSLKTRLVGKKKVGQSVVDLGALEEISQQNGEKGGDKIHTQTDDRDAQVNKKPKKRVGSFQGPKKGGDRRGDRNTAPGGRGGGGEGG